MRKILISLIVVFICLGVSQSGGAKIYKHVDENGGLHYSDSPIAPKPVHSALNISQQTRFLSYGKNRVQLDVYDPGIANAPAAILIHGSAGIDGDRAQRYQRFATDLAKQGMVAINVHYFDSPRSDWVQTILETVNALSDLENVDTNRVALIGYSLGGSLAVSASLLSNNVKVLVINAGALPKNFTQEDVWGLPPYIYMACGTKDFCYPSLQKLQSMVNGTGKSFTPRVRSGEGHTVSVDVFWQEWYEVVEFVASRL